MFLENLQSRWLLALTTLGTATMAVAFSAAPSVAEPVPPEWGTTFKIRAIQDDFLCLDVANDQIIDGRMQTSYWDCTERNTAQEWALSMDGTLRYAANPAVCVTRPDSAPGSVNDGTILLSRCVTGQMAQPYEPQQWRRGPGGTLTNSNGTQCLTRTGSYPFEGASVWMSRCGDNLENLTHKQWKFDEIGDREFNSNTGKVFGAGHHCLTYEGVERQRIQNNARVYTQDCLSAKAGGNVPDKITVGADGTLRFWTNRDTLPYFPEAESGSCLTPMRGETAAGTIVTAWECNNSKPQQWMRRTDGSLLNVAANRCLTSEPTAKVPNLATPVGTPHENRVTLEDCDGEQSQVWVLPYLSRL